MNPAEVATALLIERTLSNSTAYKKVDDSLYAVKQGSTYVLINVVPWGTDKALLLRIKDVVKETRGALSYYYLRHVLKWQNDFGLVETQNAATGPQKLWEYRSQLQFIF